MEPNERCDLFGLRLFVLCSKNFEKPEQFDRTLNGPLNS